MMRQPATKRARLPGAAMWLVSALVGAVSLPAGAVLVWKAVNAGENSVKAMGLAITGVGLVYLALYLWGIAPPQ